MAAKISPVPHVLLPLTLASWRCRGYLWSFPPKLGRLVTIVEVKLGDFGG